MSCGTEKIQKRNTISNFNILQDRSSFLLEEIKKDQDSFGFIHSDQCDSALFSGLISAGGAPVDIKAARDEKGQWFRTPYKDCYENEINDIQSSRRSKSTISRDMLIGILWSLYKTEDADALRELKTYAKKSKWIMGQGPIDRTFMTPNMRETLYNLLDQEYKGLIKGWVDPINDYDRHVVALNIALRGEKNGSISESAFDLIKKFEKIDQKNTLYKYIIARYSDKSQEQTIRMAIEQSEKYDRKMVCRRWLWEWHSDTWEGCEKKEYNTGGLTIFIYELLRNSRGNQ